MDADAILGLLIPATYFLMLGAEAIWPAREFPPVRRWRLIGFGFFVMLSTLSIMTPLLLPVEWLAHHRLMDGTRLGVVGGVVVGLLATELVSYLVHRASHRVSLMWRWMHQTHHAPRRIDIASSAVFHPLEVVVQGLIAVGVGVFVLGLHPLAGAILGYLGAFMGMFQHLNMRTPRWIGYVVQRPEAHCIHHQLNVHAYNYGNLSLWDMVFGTYKNPDTFEGRVGFEAPPAFGKMLIGRDISGGLGDGVDRRRSEQRTTEVAA